MSEFTKVAQLADIPDPGKELVEVDDNLVVIFHVEGQVYCVDDVCTHDGGPLGEGDLDGHTIACSRHGAKFDIRDGNALTMPATEGTVAHQVKVEDGAIWVKLTEEGETPPAASKVASTTPAKSTGSASVMSTGISDKPSTEKAAATESSKPAPLPGTGISEDHVLEALKKVIDPELFVNIVDLGLIYVVDIKDHETEADKKHVTIDMTMTSPACPAGPQLISGAKNAVNQLEEVADVEVKIVMEPQWTPDKMTDDARDQLGIF